jgi:hypothetical protein
VSVVVTAVGAEIFTVDPLSVATTGAVAVTADKGVFVSSENVPAAVIFTNGVPLTHVG